MAKRKPPNCGLSERHRAGVAILVEDGAITHGFAENVRTATGVDVDLLPMIVPDAHRIDHGDRRITLYEVIITHMIKPAKYAKLRQWRDVIAVAGWTMTVMTTATGHDVGEEDIDTEGPTRESMRRAVMGLDRIFRIRL